MQSHMTTEQLCQSVGLTSRELRSWLDTGLLEPASIVPRLAGDGRCYQFTDDQLQHARLIKALHQKGVALSRLARTSLAFDPGQAYVVYDGHELRACRDAAAAIGAVVRAKQRG